MAWREAAQLDRSTTENKAKHTHMFISLWVFGSSPRFPNNGQLTQAGVQEVVASPGVGDGVVVAVEVIYWPCRARVHRCGGGWGRVKVEGGHKKAGDGGRGLRAGVKKSVEPLQGSTSGLGFRGHFFFVFLMSVIRIYITVHVQQCSDTRVCSSHASIVEVAGHLLGAAINHGCEK